MRWITGISMNEVRVVVEDASVPRHGRQRGQGIRAGGRHRGQEGFAVR
jgi:hypothetical protein